MGILQIHTCVGPLRLFHRDVLEISNHGELSCEGYIHLEQGVQDIYCHCASSSSGASETRMLVLQPQQLFVLGTTTEYRLN